MKWDEWLQRFRAVARSSVLLEKASEEINSRALDEGLPVELRDELLRNARELLTMDARLKALAQRCLGDRRYRERQLDLTGGAP